MQASPVKSISNILLVLAAVVLAGALFLAQRSPSPALSLEAQAREAVPLEQALTNGKPTIAEFYADWCTSCQAMAKEFAELKQTYRDRLNFSMLNVDNTKWLPEMRTYRVNGIPHFVFFNQSGQAIAQSVGEQPKVVMIEKIEALLQNQPVPSTETIGQTSDFKSPNTAQEVSPRSHGQNR